MNLHDIASLAGNIRLFGGTGSLSHIADGDAWQVVAVRHDNTNSRLHIEDDYDVTGTTGTGWTTIGAPNLAEIILGAWAATGAGYTNFGDIEFGEMLLWKAALSDAEMDEVAAYLAGRWK